MFDGFWDSFHYLLWLFGTSIIVVINEMYEALMYLPNHLSDFLNSSVIDNAYNNFMELALVLFVFLIVFQVILKFMKFEDIASVLKNIIFIGIIIAALSTIFVFGEKLTVALVNDADNFFTEEGEDQEFGVVLANSFISFNRNDEDIPESEFSNYSSNPFKDWHDVYDPEIINARYRDETGDDNHYVYHYFPIVIMLGLCLAIMILLFLTGIKLYIAIANLLIYKMFAPILTVFKGTLDNSFKMYFTNLFIAFLSIFLQVLMIYFSATIMTLGLTIVDDGTQMVESVFLYYIIIFASLIIMYDGPRAIQDIFGIDVGLEGVVAKYSFLKAGANTAQAIGGAFDNADKGVGLALGKGKESGLETSDDISKESSGDDKTDVGKESAGDESLEINNEQDDKESTITNGSNDMDKKTDDDMSKDDNNPNQTNETDKKPIDVSANINNSANNFDDQTINKEVEMVKEDNSIHHQNINNLNDRSMKGRDE